MAENKPQEDVHDNDIHPTLMESLTIIGACLCFVESNWEKFQEEMEFVEIDEETKARMLKQVIHLKEDMGAHVARQELIQEAFNQLSSIFGL